jgi:hypothetical protein
VCNSCAYNGPVTDYLIVLHYSNITAVHKLNVSLTTSNFQDITWTHTALALGTLWSAIVYTRIDITVAGHFSGHGSGYGFGVGFLELSGTFGYDSEDTLLSAENDFVVVTAGAIGGGGVIRFNINDQIVARMVLGGIGIDITGAVKSHGRKHDLFTFYDDLFRM